MVPEGSVRDVTELVVGVDVLLDSLTAEAWSVRAFFGWTKA
jgi:hypothetical protein